MALQGPTSGEVLTASTDFTVTLGSETITGTVRFTPSASNDDGTFTPAYVDLTNTVRSDTFTYTPSVWGTRDISLDNDGGLTNPTPFAYVAKVQLGSSGAIDPTVSPNLGRFNVFATGAWWQELGRPVTSDSVVSDSASRLALISGTYIHCDWASSGYNATYGIPYNVVPGTQSLIEIENLGSTDSVNQSDPSTQVPFWTGMSVELCPTFPTWPPEHDQHGSVYVRNETTGGIDVLWEGYHVCWDSDNSMIAVTQLSKFDLVTGAPRHETWTSADAAGLPVAPLVLNYNEAYDAAYNGIPINHPIRCAINNAAVYDFFVWPARHFAYGGDGGLPMGARLRLSSSWYNTYRSSFSPIAQAILDCFRNYGLIVADIDGGLSIQGTNDYRWDQDDLTPSGSNPYMWLQQIPISAFEVLDTIHPPISITGPGGVSPPFSGVHGTPYTITITWLWTNDSNFFTSVYCSTTTQNDHTGWADANVTMDDTHHVRTNQFTPPSAGTWTLIFDYGGNNFVPHPNITFNAS